MKSELKMRETSDQTYPYIGYSKSFGLCVLFTKPRTGMLIKSDAHKVIGEYCSTWTEEAYERLNGSVTLSND